jgi:predicted CoA-binding protein
MQGYGFKIIPVRPMVSEILGEKAYANLSDVPEKIDLVNVFRQASCIPDIVHECIDLNIKALWVQLGIVNEGAARLAQQHGIMTVMDLCIYQFYSRNCR